MNRLYYILAFALLYLGLLGCEKDFLDRPPKDEVDAEFFYNTVKDLEVATNDFYTMLDAENVYTVLTARQMNDEMYIVSRAINKNATGKLKKAGADNTISPNEIGGSRMASLMIRPNVMSFLDVVTRAGDVILDLEEVKIHRNSELIDKKLKDSQIPQKTGLIVLALKEKGSDEMIFNPSSDEILSEGVAMIVLGKGEQVDELRKMAKES